MKFFGVLAAVICAVTLMGSDVSAMMINGGIYRDQNGDPLTGLHYGYEISYDNVVINSSDFFFDGFIRRKSLMWSFDDEGHLERFYSGYTSSEKGKRYYDNGKRVIGWYKMPEGWRHFDNDGYMSTGKTEIGNCNYYFDENGLWTGELDKKGLAPEDFAISFKYDFIAEIMGADSGFDTGVQSSKPRKFFSEHWFIQDDDGNTHQGDASREITISAADRQVLYCMFIESGFGEADLSRDLGDNYLHEYMDKHNKDENGYIKTFADIYLHNSECGETDTGSKITVAANGKTYSVRYGEDIIGQLSYTDETSHAVIFLSDSLSYYDSFLAQEFPQTYR